MLKFGASTYELCYLVAKSCLTLCDHLDCITPGFPVLYHLPEFAQTHVHWVSDAISSSFTHFSSYPQSLPASGSFPVSQLFPSGGQRIGASVLASVFPMNIQSWFPLGWTGWISLMPKGLSRAFSSTTIQRHQFFGTQPSLRPNSHIHTWLLEKNTALITWTFVDKSDMNFRRTQFSPQQGG